MWGTSLLLRWAGLSALWVPGQTVAATMLGPPAVWAGRCELDVRRWPRENYSAVKNPPWDRGVSQFAESDTVCPPSTGIVLRQLLEIEKLLSRHHQVADGQG